MGATSLIALGTAYKAFDDQQKMAESQGRQIQLKRNRERKSQENLLEKQLATHRARVGAMGLNSGSDDNVQKNMAKNSIIQIEDNNQLYDEMQDNLTDGYQNSLVNAGISYATKMIK